MKKLPSTILTGAAFALLLVGCGQQDDRDARTSDTGSSIMNEDRTSQAPARDPSLPAGDNYYEQDGTGSTGAGSTGMDSGDTGSTGIDSTSPGSTGAAAPGPDAAGTTMDGDGRISGGQDSSADRDQTSPETLSQDEERNEMPLPGQNSDHSTPNPDQTSSR